MKHTKWSKRVERNILCAYLSANNQDRNEGMFWYHNAHNNAEAIAKRFKLSTAQVIGAIAALSPGNRWGKNLLDVEALIEEWQGGKVANVGTYGKRNVIKGIRILNGEEPLEVLHGNKTRAFYSNILSPDTSMDVTIDRHAKGLALGKGSDKPGSATPENNANVTPREYPWYAWHYQALADRLGLLPSQLQAITWVVWKRLEGQIGRI